MSWQNQDTVYLVMWKSPKSGGTYSDIKKTDKGLDNFLKTLRFLGYKDEDITIIPQKKAWKPDLKRDGKIKKQNPLLEVTEANGWNTLHH